MNINVGGPGRASGGCGSIFGVFFGIALIPLGIYLAYYGEAKLINHGAVFDGIIMTAPQDTKTQEALVKTHGHPEGDFLEADHHNKPVIYFRDSIERYERQEDSDGDVSYSWETVESKARWASFHIGDINVTPDAAKAVGDREIFRGLKTSNTYGRFDPSLSDGQAEVGDLRRIISVMDADQEVIVVGRLLGRNISDGSTFVVSVLDEAGTSAALHTEYKILFWLIKGGAVLCIWIGFVSIFGPLMRIVGYIPLLGNHVTGMLNLVFLVVSVFIVAVITFLTKFFWFVVAAVFLFVVFFIYRGATTPREGPLPPVPPAPPSVPPVPPGPSGPPMTP